MSSLAGSYHPRRAIAGRIVRIGTAGRKAAVRSSEHSLFAFLARCYNENPEVQTRALQARNTFRPFPREMS
jgi:hypothetical protein